MATWDDVARVALSLPETNETTKYGNPAWAVRGRGFVWERPLRESDRKALGAATPDGPILGAHVPDLTAKEALLADDPEVYFTTPHFDGYAAILVRLERITLADLRELVTEAWLCRAPKRLMRQYLDEQSC